MKGRKTGGRRKGTQNKTTRAFKEAVILAFEGIGGDDGFQTWARDNRTEFYKIAARLIPTEVAGSPQMRPLVIDVITHADVSARDADSE